MRESTLSTALWCSVIPKRPANDRTVCTGVCVRQIADLLGRHPCQALGIVERVRLYAGSILFEAGGSSFDKRVIDEAGPQDLPRYGVGEGDVSADFKSEPAVSPLRRALCAGDR